MYEEIEGVIDDAIEELEEAIDEIIAELEEALAEAEESEDGGMGVPPHDDPMEIASDLVDEVMDGVESVTAGYPEEYTEVCCDDAEGRYWAKAFPVVMDGQLEISMLEAEIEMVQEEKMMEQMLEMLIGME